MSTRHSTPSEGEIIESDSEKATKSQPLDGTTVDRQSRKRVSVSRSPSPIFSPKRRRSNSRSRSRSPYRESRGAKRFRDDDHYSQKERGDPRRFRIHYENGRHEGKVKGRSPYSELDRGSGRDPKLRYEEHSLSSRDRRLRTESRSPPRFSDRKPNHDRSVHIKGNERLGLGKRQDDRGYKESKTRLSREQSVSDRGQTSFATASAKREAETGDNQIQRNGPLNPANGSAADKCVHRCVRICTH